MGQCSVLVTDFIRAAGDTLRGDSSAVGQVITLIGGCAARPPVVDRAPTHHEYRVRDQMENRG